MRYCWDARGPSLPSRSSPASASAGSSRYTWLRVTEKKPPNRSPAAATSSPPVMGPSWSRPRMAAAVAFTGMGRADMPLRCHPKANRAGWTNQERPEALRPTARRPGSHLAALSSGQRQPGIRPSFALRYGRLTAARHGRSSSGPSSPDRELRDAGAVGARVAPLPGQPLGALVKQVRLVLPRVADAAVVLDHRAGARHG